MKDKEAQLYIILSVVSLLFIALVVGRVQAGPPARVTFAAGPSDGAYYKFAKEYQQRLTAKGLEVEVLTTSGSVENLRLLREGQADVAFVQSGLTSQESELQSLGSMFPEPLWLFCRLDEPITKLSQLQGKRVAIGSEESGTQAVALTILQDARMTAKIETASTDGATAKEQLLSGEIDAAFFVGSPTVDSIQELAMNPDIQLANFQRVQAYARFHSFLSAVKLYAGMLDLSADIPDHDINLLATSCSMVVSDDFHYALVTLFLQTASQVHEKPGPFQVYGEYPSPRNISLPLMPEAQKFYKDGPSFFFRYLPFFWAATVDRLIILLLPLLTLLFPLFRIAPPLYGWVLRRKLLAKQDTLKDIELNEDGQSLQERQSVVEELVKELSELKNLPPNYQNEVFLFQLRLERVQEQLAKEPEQDS